MFDLCSRVNTVFMNWFLNTSSIQFFRQTNAKTSTLKLNANKRGQTYISSKKSTAADRVVPYGWLLTLFINSGVFSD